MIFSTSFGLSGRKLIRRVLLSTIFITLIAFGVFAILKNIKGDVNAATADGADVKVSHTSGWFSVPNSSWTTPKFTVKASGSNHTGFCGSPGKSAPSGDFEAEKKSNNNAINNAVKLLLFAATHTKYSNAHNKIKAYVENFWDGIKEKLHEDNLTEDEIYAYTYEMIGILRDTDNIIDKSGIHNLEAVNSAITYITGKVGNPSSEVWAIAKDWQLYGINNSSNEQEVLWVEVNRQNSNIDIQKCDSVSDKCVPSGAVDFSGVNFNLIYTGTEYIYDEKQHTVFKNEDIVRTGTTNRLGQLSFQTVPVGSYKIVETGSTNPALIVNSSHQFITTVGSQTSSVRFENQVVRGDIRFVKKDQDNNPMKDIPFMITNTDTGEVHVVVSDDNGVVDTANSANRHSNHTNGYDSLNPDTIEYQGYGTWFEWTTDGSSTVNDNYGALPYGNYTIREIACDNNDDCRDTTGPIDFEINENNINKDLGEWVNDCTNFGMGTTASDDSDGDHYVANTTNAKIKDTITYTVEANKSYTVRGRLMDASTGQPIVVNGSYVEQTKTILASSKKTGSTDMVFTFDASHLAGKKIVVYEYIYDGNDLVVSHENINDKNQTIYIVELVTNAYDDADGDKYVQASENASIRDVITYCLQPKTNYTIIGEVYDATTGSVIKTQSEILRLEDTSNSCNRDDGYEMVFTGINAVAGHELVVRETVKKNGKVVISHTDSTDQTVYVVSLASNANDTIDEDHYIEAGKTTAVRDIVTFHGKKNTTYKFESIFKIKGTDTVLYAQEDTADTDANGEGALIVIRNLAIPEDFGGKEIIIYEYMYEENAIIGRDNPIIKHEDDNDANQTIYIVSLGTTAYGTLGDEGDKYIEASDNVALYDKITYCLKPRTNYTITGEVYDATAGSVIQTKSEILYLDKTDEACGDYVMTFSKINASTIAGHKLVVHETVTKNGGVVVSHTEETGQTVYVVSLGTKASDATDNDEYIEASENASIKDVIEYCLQPNTNYTIVGEVIDITTNSLIKTKTETLAVGDDACEDYTMTFSDINTSTIAGHTLVVHETVKLGDRIVASHTDPRDQTVYVVSLGTNAADKADDNDSILADSDQVIVDTVNYCLAADRTYTIKGILKDAATGENLLVDGHTIEQSVQITPTGNSRCGQIKLEYALDATKLAGKKIVVFEYAFEGEHKVVTHEDINDEDQDIYVVSLGTTAIDASTGNDSIEANEEGVVKDVIDYCLVKDRNYVIVGVLKDGNTGEDITIDGQVAKQSVPLTPEANCGQLELIYNLDASTLAGKEVVVFEYAYEVETGDELKLIVSHEDINDRDQTVTVVKVETSASDAKDGDKDVLAEEDAKVVDKITYCLNAGEEYTIKGLIMDKQTGQPLSIGGNTVEESFTFVPQEGCGTLELTFEFDAVHLAGAKLVVFESVYQGERLITAHEDIDDEDQTINVYPPTPDTGLNSVPMAGKPGDANGNLVFIIAASIVSVVTFYVGYRIVSRHNSLKF